MGNIKIIERHCSMFLNGWDFYARHGENFDPQETVKVYQIKFGVSEFKARCWLDGYFAARRKLPKKKW